jgi:hypothetical protein
MSSELSAACYKRSALRNFAPVVARLVDQISLLLAGLLWHSPADVGQNKSTGVQASLPRGRPGPRTRPRTSYARAAGRHSWQLERLSRLASSILRRSSQPIPIASSNAWLRITRSSRTRCPGRPQAARGQASRVDDLIRAGLAASAIGKLRHRNSRGRVGNPPPARGDDFPLSSRESSAALGAHPQPDVLAVR